MAKAAHEFGECRTGLRGEDCSGVAHVVEPRIFATGSKCGGMATSRTPASDFAGLIERPVSEMSVAYQISTQVRTNSHQMNFPIVATDPTAA